MLKKGDPLPDTLSHFSKEKLNFEKFKAKLNEMANNNLKNNILLLNDIQELHNLYLYQYNYDNILHHTRRITSYSFIAFLLSLLIGVLKPKGKMKHKNFWIY